MEDNFGSLIGKTLIKVDAQSGGNIVTLHTADEEFRMYHYQDCCENVWLDDIAGDVADLIGTPILLAEDTSESNPESSESGTWTFYKLATVKGHVTFRWLGESNGYYSESVDFERVPS